MCLTQSRVCESGRVVRDIRGVNYLLNRGVPRRDLLSSQPISGLRVSSTFYGVSTQFIVCLTQSRVCIPGRVVRDLRGVIYLLNRGVPRRDLLSSQPISG